MSAEELSPLASQFLHWRAARAEAATPGTDDAERLERIRRLAFAAILEELASKQPLLDVLEESEALQLSGDARGVHQCCLDRRIAIHQPASVAIYRIPSARDCAGGWIGDIRSICRRGHQCPPSHPAPGNRWKHGGAPGTARRPIAWRWLRLSPTSHFVRRIGRHDRRKLADDALRRADDLEHGMVDWSALYHSMSVDARFVGDRSMAGWRMPSQAELMSTLGKR